MTGPSCVPTGWCQTLSSVVKIRVSNRIGYVQVQVFSHFRSVRKRTELQWNNNLNMKWMACQLEASFELPCRVRVVLKRSLWSGQISGAAAVGFQYHPTPPEFTGHVSPALSISAPLQACRSFGAILRICSQSSQKPIMSFSHSSCPTDSLKPAACWELQG